MDFLLRSVILGGAVLIAGGVFRMVLDFMSARLKRTVAPWGTFEWHAKMVWYAAFAGAVLVGGIAMTGLAASYLLVVFG